MSNNTKIVYAILFISLVIQPHIIKGHILGFAEPIAESLVTITLFLIGYIVFRLHYNQIKTKQKEVDKLEGKLDVSSKRLIESYEYIGLVNRKLPLMERLTSDLLERTPTSKKEKSKIFSDLLTATSGLAGVDWGMFRVVNTEKVITEKEFITANKQYTLLKTQISNKELLNCNGDDTKVYTIDDVMVMRSSDVKSTEQLFLILPKIKQTFSENVQLIQNITDQAQLFYKYLYKTT